MPSCYKITDVLECYASKFARRALDEIVEPLGDMIDEILWMGRILYFNRGVFISVFYISVRLKLGHRA